MKAIIMAGGEGSRLRPLTCDCPKPMVPLMDRPVMAWALELLRRHGVREAAVTLQYLPERVKEYFGDGSETGVQLSYYVEETPLGTAGSVKQAEAFLTETFVVLSGDGVTDCDLTQALRLHRERGALATLVTRHVEMPLEYGVVIADADGRIRRFVEKPGWGEVFSDTVNTGIYILEPEVLRRIPADKPFDFGRELFPAMVEEGLPVYSYVMNGYWCDIGDISAYLRAHLDALEGRIGLPIHARPGGVWRMPGAQVDGSAVLEGPCYIGAGAAVGAGARIGPYSVLGAGCRVEENASVKRAVLWPGAQVMRGAQARGCVLTAGSRMEEGSCAFEESVLGAGSALGSNATLLPGVKVWPMKQVSSGTRLDANLVWGGSERPTFLAGHLALIHPAQAARAAQAYAAALKPRNVLLGRASTAVALACSLAVEAGLMAQGVQVLNAGISTLPQLRVMQHALSAGGALFVDGESMRPLDEQGAALTVQQRRKIEALLLRQDYDRPFGTLTRLPVSAGRSDLLYIGQLLQGLDGGPAEQRPPVALHAPNEQLLSAAECAFEKAGYFARAEWDEGQMGLEEEEVGIWLTEGGEQSRFAGEDGSLTESENLLLRVWTLLEMGKKEIVLPMSATRAADALAARYEAQVLRVKGEAGSYMHALLAADPTRAQLMMQFDGLYAALHCLEMLERKGLTLGRWQREMPRLNRRTCAVPVGWKDKGRVLGALLEGEDAADLTDGMAVSHRGGWAWVAPAEDAPECRIVAEAMNAETADELCAFYSDRIAAALNAPPAP